MVTLKRHLLLLLVTVLSACQSGNKPAETQRPTQPVAAAKADSVSILAASHELYKAVLEDTSAVIHYTFTDSAVVYADSACQVPLQKLPRHTPFRLPLRGDRTYQFSHYALPAHLPDGRHGYIRTSDIGCGRTWRAGNKDYFCIVANANEESPYVAVYELYEGSQLLSRRSFQTATRPMPLPPIAAVQGVKLPAPLYIVYSKSYECGVPDFADLYFFHNGQFHFLKNRLYTYEGDEGVASFELLKGNELVFLQATFWGESWEEQRTDSSYISEHTTYAWRDGRFVRTDSLPMTPFVWDL